MGVSTLLIAGIILYTINSYKKYPYENSLEWLHRFTNRFLPNWQKKDTDFAQKTYMGILDDFEKIAKIANLLQIEVLSTSSTSPLNSLLGFRFMG
jgi:hypothetical protein